jgi:hypothetical protein
LVNFKTAGILIFLFCSLAQNIFASQDTVVVTDGAMVYKNADFDAAVISYLHLGQKVNVSDKKFGQGFYKVQLKAGVNGYISDVDIAAGKAQISRGEQDSGASPGEGGDKKSKTSTGVRPAFSRKMLGVAVGLINFSELILSQAYVDNLISYGLKYSGPFPWLGGPFVLDINILYHNGAPRYYTGFGASGAPAPTGFLVQADLTVLYQAADFASRKGTFYFGAGPLASVSNFFVNISNSNTVQEQTRVGATGVVGVGMGLKSIYLKAEARYYFEITRYPGFQGSIQYGF